MSRIVFVTGASRGIGRGIAAHFLEQGYEVAVGYCNTPSGAERICRDYPNAFPVKIDISSRESVRLALAETNSHYGKSVEVLVNNAAISQEKSFFDLSDDDWQRMLSVNLQGPFVLTQEALPPMLENGWGRIINIVSIGGQWGGYNQVHYAAAKAGVTNFTQSIAKLYSAKGITSNAVSPGLVATDMAADELASEAGREKVKGIPAGRIGTVEDVAGAVFYLASDESSYITGQTINVNGGMYFG